MKEYKYGGETFSLDDSKGCYIEVNHKGLVGYVGVYLGGTQEKPFAWSAPPYIGGVPTTANGLAADTAVPVSTINEALDTACRWLINKHKEEESKKVFDPESACKALHEFVESLD